MDKLAQMVAMGAAGSGAAGPLSVEDVFSTWLYKGTGSTQTITNGIDLAGEGGLVWLKNRDTINAHALTDTERGLNKWLATNVTDQQYTIGGFTSFNNDGFTLNNNTTGVYGTNASGEDVVSWTFRKAPGFFDVVTFSTGGTLSTSRAISHGLGSAPGFVIIKSTTTAQNWLCYHRSLGQSSYIPLNLAQGQNTTNQWWTATPPTSTDFYLNETLLLNTNQSYVAYLFAHNEAVFGENEDQSIISCGSFTGNSSADGPEVNLGWEPQWVLVKPYTGTRETSSWRMYDVMRGITSGPSSNGDLDIQPHSSAIEGSQNYGPTPTPTGFKIEDNNLFYNDSGTSYIYIAIRRGPMRTPTDATTVFAPVAYTGNGTSNTTVQYLTTNIAADTAWITARTSQNRQSFDKIRGTGYSLYLSSSAQEQDFEASYSGASVSFNNTQTVLTGQYTSSGLYNYNGTAHIAYNFRRAPGFFDVVTYTGDGVSTGQYINHSLNVNPEMIIVKPRNFVWPWHVFHKDLGAGGYMQLQSDSSFATNSNTSFGSVTPTATQFFRKGNNDNASGQPYIAYLFASCPGVSKVGSYTGTGSTLNVDCGFSAGARFVLIKRTDTQITGPTPPTGYYTDWYVWDTARGIVAGNDPYLRLNVNDAEDTGTDFIDPYSAGFTVTSSAPDALNASGGTYIFLAIA